MFGLEILGTYTFAMQAISVGLVLLNGLQTYLTPKWLRSWASSSDPVIFWNRAFGWLVAMSCVCITGAVAMMFVSPAIIQRWWPAYEAALMLLPWVLVGAVAVALGFFDIFFLATNAGVELILVHVMAIIILSIMLAVFVWMRVPVEVFAIGFSSIRVFTVVIGWYRGRNVLMATQH